MNSMKVPLCIAIYALLITFCSTKSNSSSNKTPRKEVYYKSIQNFGISFSDRTSGPSYDQTIKSTRFLITVNYRL